MGIQDDLDLDFDIAAYLSEGDVLHNTNFDLGDYVHLRGNDLANDTQYDSYESPYNIGAETIGAIPIVQYNTVAPDDRRMNDHPSATLQGMNTPASTAFYREGSISSPSLVGIPTFASDVPVSTIPIAQRLEEPSQAQVNSSPVHGTATGTIPLHNTPRDMQLPGAPEPDLSHAVVLPGVQISPIPSTVLSETLDAEIDAVSPSQRVGSATSLYVAHTSISETAPALPTCAPLIQEHRRSNSPDELAVDQSAYISNASSHYVVPEVRTLVVPESFATDPSGRMGADSVSSPARGNGDSESACPGETSIERPSLQDDSSPSSLDHGDPEHGIEDRVENRPDLEDDSDEQRTRSPSPGFDMGWASLFPRRS